MISLQQQRRVYGRGSESMTNVSSKVVTTVVDIRRSIEKHPMMREVIHNICTVKNHTTKIITPYIHEVILLAKHRCYSL